MIDREDSLPVTRQCEILELSRSGIYYTPVPISARDMELMRQIDEVHLLYPFYGSRNIRHELWGKGYDIGRDRVRRLRIVCWILCYRFISISFFRGNSIRLCFFSGLCSSSLDVRIMFRHCYF
jgi:hypothetical protein